MAHSTNHAVQSCLEQSPDQPILSQIDVSMMAHLVNYKVAELLL
jgi:hypothetical protein